MPTTDDLVSVCLPVRNGASRLEGVVRSVLTQDHGNLELVISDNASTDDTEAVCRELARADPRVVYHRQPHNIGLLNNFVAAMRLARGRYFRWVGDDDWLAPACLSRCLDAFAADDRLILVTMQLGFVDPDGTTRTAAYRRTELSSDDPVARFTEMLRLLNDSYLLIDPLYGLMRRTAITPIPRRNMLREDQIFAAKMALAGPWGHVHEVLGRRGWEDTTRPQLARRLGVPAWHAPVATALQLRELLRAVGRSDLDPAQRRRARAAVLRWYAGRQRIVLANRRRQVARAAGRLVTSRRTAGSGSASGSR
jgi:glycosyltransferase involved in cell wall biosynthesis